MSSKPANCYTCKEVIPGSKFTIDPQNCYDCREKLFAAREKNETRSERESRERTREFVEAVARFGRGGGDPYTK